MAPTEPPAQPSRQLTRRRQKPPSPPSTFTGAEVVAGFVGVSMLLVAVLFEIFHEGFGEAMKDHPVIAGLVSGGLLLTPLIYVFERVVARREQQRQAELERREELIWKRPAEDAVRAFVYSANRVTRWLRREVPDRAHRIDASVHGLAECLALIAEHDPDFFDGFSEAMFDAIADAGPAASATTATLALYAPMRAYVEPVSDVQRRIAAMGDAAGVVFFYARSRRPEDQAALDRAIGRLNDLAFEYSDKLSDIHLDLADVLDVPLEQ